MNSKTKLWVAVYLAITLLGAATVLANTIYLPVIVKSPTITPTPTFTSTPTVTRTPSITSTPTRTPTPKPGVYVSTIVAAPVVPLDEYIEIENTSNNSVNMKNWYIKVESNSAMRYNFPDFTLGGGKTVRVWTKFGQDTTSNLFWNWPEPIWKDNGDCAYLRDNAGVLRDKYCYGKASLWLPEGENNP